MDTGASSREHARLTGSIEGLQMYARTKIVATMGPASAPEKRMRALFEAGVNVCRLNFSHGTHEDHLQMLERIRAVSADMGLPIAVLQDLCGPKIRTSKLPGREVRLSAGQVVTLVAGLEQSDDPSRIGVSVDKLAEEARPEQRILLDDGLLEMEVISTNPEEKTLKAKVIFGGTLKERKGVNLPDTRLSLTSFTEKDRRDMAWGLEHGVDYVAMSFVRHEDDVLPMKEMMRGITDPPRIIAKVEKPEALLRLEQIIEAFDGVMVARGDLAVETPLHKVPAIQKKMIRLANMGDRLVITATQMLDSMQENPRPTRAEVSDVANAIYDGTDAVMLSGETAAGKYPVEAVRTMRQIADYADHDCETLKGSMRHESKVDVTSFSDAMCHGAVRVADDLKARALVTFTMTGRTALFMTKYHPTIPIIGVTTEPRTLRRMALYRGVVPVLVKKTERSEELVAEAEAAIAQRNLARPGDLAVYVGGGNLTARGNINSLKVRRIGDAGGV
jgi:pyruvate kinase